METLLSPLCPDEWRDANGRVTPLRVDVTMRIHSAVAVVAECQVERSETQEITAPWSAALAIKSPRRLHYLPRWTFRILYFRPPAAEYLFGACGLDVGANVKPFGSFQPRLLVPPAFRVDDFTECHVPHHVYYSEIGCQMQAIDLQPAQQQIEHGDARLLRHADASLDFITAPMLLGPSNVCATPLEIAFCLSEFNRVLRPGGLVYFADPSLEPSVIFTAQCSGFSAFGSKGLKGGVPLGTILRKHGRHKATAKFQPIFEDLSDVMLHFSDAQDQAILFSDLVNDQAQPLICELIS